MNQKQIYMIALILIATLGVALLTIPSLVRLATVVPGPEGIKSYAYGAQFADFSSTLHKIGEMQPNELLEGPKTLGTDQMSIYAGFPDPKNPVFRKGNTQNQWQSLVIDQKPPTTEDVNQRGFGTDPSIGSWTENGIIQSPTNVRYLEYYKKKSESGNQVTFEKVVVHVVAVDAVLELSARGDINTWDSSEPRWTNTHLWFVLDTNVWYQAFTESQANQILDRNPPANSTLTAYTYRGGFPIWGWIQQWDPMVWEVKDQSGQTTSTPNPPANALDCIQIYPSIGGHEVTLYTEPGYNYNLTLAQDIVENPNMLDNSLMQYFPMLPDPRFAVNAYFSIYIDRFYPYRQFTGPLWNVGESWQKWSPTAYLRIRFLYAVYGDFVYLWTKQEEQQFDYVWQNRSSTYSYALGGWDRFIGGIGQGLGALFANPLFWIASFLIGAFILIVLLLVFAGPAVSVLFQWAFGGKQRGRHK
jgi:hypothetical protein